MDSIQRRIMITSLPDISLSEMDFRDTSFFQSQETPVELPTPAEIMQKYPEIGDGSGIARFDDINLIVKLGPTDYLRLEEVQTMWAMRQVFPNGEIPVPEVFGWRTVDDRHFIYMSLIRGSTLLHAWDHFTDADKECLRDQMKQVVKDLRSLSQSIDHNHNHWIGSINGGHVQDRYFKLDYEEGPFLDIKSFNDWVLAAATRQRPRPGGPVQLDHLRDWLSDEGEIYFAHGDLTISNIIVSDEPGDPKIVGIIDWEQAGWYPEYWEYCKLRYGVPGEHEWKEEDWANAVMRPFEDEYEAFMWYSGCRGCP